MTRGKLILDSVILLSVAAVLVLGGCVSTREEPTSSIVVPAPAVVLPAPGTTLTTAIGTSIGVVTGALIDEHAPGLSSLVRNSCGWIITAADFAGLTGQMPSVDAAADAICKALQERRTRARAGSTTTVYLNGVKLTLRKAL